jgi:hypothetical protein
MAGSFLIGAAHVGALIDQHGLLVGIGYQKAPKTHEPAQFDPATGFPKAGYFCLIDKPDDAPPRQLFNVDMNNNALFSAVPDCDNNMLFLQQGIPFDALYVASCPKGAAFSITTVGR